MSRHKDDSFFAIYCILAMLQQRSLVQELSYSAGGRPFYCSQLLFYAEHQYKNQYSSCIPTADLASARGISPSMR